MAVNFPNNPAFNQTFTVGTITWRWNGYAWNRIPDPGAKGEIGTKGDKGEVGLTGATGAQGTQGPTGPQGTQGSSGTQGPAGPIGPQGPQGSSGTQGPTGPQGAQGPPGPPGSNATLPTGTIVAYGGNSAPTGWQLCNGGTASSSALQTVLGQSNVPDLRDRFIIGAGNSYSRHNTGGSKDATLVSHSHPFSASTTGGNHNHQYIDQYVVINNGYRPWPANNNDCAQRNINTSGSGSHTHSFSGTTDAQGSSATNANLPPYYALVFIIKT